MNLNFRGIHWKVDDPLLGCLKVFLRAICRVIRKKRYMIISGWMRFSGTVRPMPMSWIFCLTAHTMVEHPS